MKSDARMKHLALAAGLAWALGFGPANARSEDMRKLDGVKYLPEGRAETMWLRVPAGAGADHRLPAILIVPGGGWGNHFGKKYVATAEELAGWGYVTAVIDYRIVSDEARGVSYLHNVADSFPQCLKDCKTAVRFLRRNAGRYGIAPDHIGVLGSSAGGHLAAMTAVVQPKDGMEPDDDGLGDVSSAVQACVSYYGAHDFATWGGKPGKDTPEDLAAARKASTVNYVDKHDPPILVIHGNKDRTVPVAQSRKLAEALKQAGAPCEYWEVDGAGHGSCLNGKIAGDAERVRVFFGAHLKGAE